MYNGSLNLIKRDANDAGSIEIALFEIIDFTSGKVSNHVVKKNGKSIGWATERWLAIELHEMFVRVQIVRDNDSDPNHDVKTKETRARLKDGIRNNNSHLNDNADTFIG